MPILIIFVGAWNLMPIKTTFNLVVEAMLTHNITKENIQ